jgi:hypothetical protein
MYYIGFRQEGSYSSHDRHHCGVSVWFFSAHCSAHSEGTKTEG